MAYLVSASIELENYPNNSLWDLKEVTFGSLSAGSAVETYIGILVTFNWERKTLYYTFNMLLPTILLLVISLFVFWLPPECGERMSLVITVLLSFAVFLIIIMENTPINSEQLPLISKRLLVL